MKLDGKICVVTGGAMGNGLGVVEVFLKYGATVIVLDYDNKVLEMNAKYDGKVTGYKVDIRDRDGVNRCINEVYNQYGRIDVLVNNAGVCRLESFEDMSDELRDFQFDINIKGTWNVTKACLPYMKNKDSA